MGNKFGSKKNRRKPKGEISAERIKAKTSAKSVQSSSRSNATTTSATRKTPEVARPDDDWSHDQYDIIAASIDANHRARLLQKALDQDIEKVKAKRKSQSRKKR